MPTSTSPQGVQRAGSLGELRAAGEAALGRAVVLKLNGGLGTGMGLKGAKSLLQAKDGRTFLEIVAR